MNGSDLFGYYEQLKREVQAKVRGTPEEQAATYDETAWIDNLYENAALQPIQIDPQREEHLVREESGIRFVVPVVPSSTLSTIVDHQLHSSTRTLSFSLSSINYIHWRGELWVAASDNSEEVKRRSGFLREQIQRWNNDINAYNGPFREFIAAEVRRRLSSIRSRDESLAKLEAQTGIKLATKADPATIIPVAVTPKREVRPLLRDSAEERRPVLDRETLDAILILIDNQGRQFERTPTVFAGHSEEDLRDILLSSLNAVFAGRATGEAFSVLGKADIHLRISGGDLFIAECKWWSGRASLEEAVTQLLDRLTWHESFGVVLMFSRNTGFRSVVEEIERSLTMIKGFKGPVRKVSEHQFAASFLLPTDTSKVIEIRALAYNLFVPRKSGRSKV